MYPPFSREDEWVSVLGMRGTNRHHVNATGIEHLTNTSE
jgi:hypothetical protein